MKRHPIWQLACLVLPLGIHLWLVPSVSRADLLDFQFASGGPVVLANNGSLTYSASTGEFQSISSPLSITADALAPYGGTALFDNGGTLTIDLVVNSSGGFVSNGSGVTLTGSIDLDGDGIDDTSGTLLQGHITNFGADPAGPPTWRYNGLFVVDSGSFTGPIALSGGGSLGPLFTVGGLAGFISFVETVSGGTLGDFTQDFSGTDKPELDSVVPVPATILLALLGGGMLAAARFFKQRGLASRPWPGVSGQLMTLGCGRLLVRSSRVLLSGFR